MDYDVYHDESREAGYWHGILLVPGGTRRQFFDFLQQFRRNTEYEKVIQFKGLKRTTGKRFRCIRAWLNFGVAALVQDLKGTRHPFYTGRDARGAGMDLLDNVIAAKFILFRVRDDHRDLENYPDCGAKVETTFRMGLKGGLHLLAQESSELCVRSFHFDGHEHYGRKLDAGRIIGRLGSLRGQIRIPDDAPIDDSSGDHTKAGSQPYDDCQFLQLTDLFVGGFRTVLGSQSNAAQGEVAAPLRELARKWHEGPARMRNSRWYRGFCVSECYLENDQWSFTHLSPAVADMQPSLPGL